MGNIIQMRKEAVPFLESLGIPKPHSKEEWSYIFKEMGTFLAAKNFTVNCPLPVMEMPVAPIHDSKEALRFRAICDKRITLPLASLKAFDSVYTKLVAGLSKSLMVEVKVNWRCNVAAIHSVAWPRLWGGGECSLLGLVFTTVSSLIPFWWRTWVFPVAWQWSHVTAA